MRPRSYDHRVDVAFVKGHGTENDFVLLPDLADRLELTPGLVAAICDRRAGIGADGVLRVVRNRAGSAAPWLMDYRNADGSVAEMCGNGLRVLARYLVSAGLADPGQVAIETRSGVRLARLAESGDVTVELGAYERPDLGQVQIRVGARAWDATAIRMPNPHLVAFVEHLDDAGDLRVAPGVEPGTAAPDGANVELVVHRGPRHVAMRVFERGVGETRSCGTGAAAAAIAAGHVAGEHWACQANMMARATVPDAMSAAFAAAGGDLAERLMIALEGAEAEGGDVRGRQSAALLVTPAQGERWQARMDLRVEDHADPIAELRRLLALQRAYELAGEADELMGAGRMDAAAEMYLRASGLAPQSDELLFWAGLAIAQRGDVAAGADAVRRAAKVHPGWLTLLERLSPEFAPAGEAVRRELRGR